MIDLKIISGGQTGVDQAGLDAAYVMELKTGGYIPKGFRTLEGPRPDLAKKYGLQEHTRADYPPRTYLNVKESDATIRLYRKVNSAGELCTLKAIQQYNKPFLDVDFSGDTIIVTAKQVSSWIINNGFKVVNIAGNSEQTAKGIYAEAFIFLKEVFLIIKEREMDQGKRYTRKEAESMGFTVDSHCYPYVAYREEDGRFSNGTKLYVLTEREELVLEFLEREILPQCHSLEGEVKQPCLVKKIEDLVKKIKSDSFHS